MAVDINLLTIRPKRNIQGEKCVIREEKQGDFQELNLSLALDIVFPAQNN